MPVMSIGPPENNPQFIIPKGTKNVVIITYGTPKSTTGEGDNDLEVFALDPGDTSYGSFKFVQLAGTSLETDVAPLAQLLYQGDYYLRKFSPAAGAKYDMRNFETGSYDVSYLNKGPAQYDPNLNTLQYVKYKGMTIGYSDDPDQHDAIPNDGILQTWNDYEIVTIDEVTEDILIGIPGFAGVSLKMYWNLPDSRAGGMDGAGQAI